jgi:hypothetical protein
MTANRIPSQVDIGSDNLPREAGALKEGFTYPSPCAAKCDNESSTPLAL